VTHLEPKPTLFEQEHGDPVPLGRTFVVFLVLIGLTAFQIMTGFTDMGSAKVWVNLGIAGTQGVVLSLFFMDLWRADKLTILTAIAALFWTFLLFLFTLTDYLTRHLFAF
jgi:caa(3)-type oxidase subunit IV